MPPFPMTDTRTCLHCTTLYTTQIGHTSSTGCAEAMPTALTNPETTPPFPDLGLLHWDVIKIITNNYLTVLKTINYFCEQILKCYMLILNFPPPPRFLSILCPPPSFSFLGICCWRFGFYCSSPDGTEICVKKKSPEPRDLSFFLSLEYGQLMLIHIAIRNAPLSLSHTHTLHWTVYFIYKLSEKCVVFIVHYWIMLIFSAWSLLWIKEGKEWLEAI